MRKKIFIFTIFLFFLVSFVSASSHDIEISQVDNNLLIKHKISLDFPQTISLGLPQDALSLSSNSEYSLSANTLTVYGKEIDVSYLTQSALESAKGGYYFVSKIDFNFPVNKSQIKLTLQEGYYLDNEKVFPKPSEIGTDGEQIFVLWDLKDIKAGDDMPIFVNIKSRGSSLAWITWTLSIIVTLLVFYFVYDKIISEFLIKPARKERKAKKRVKSNKVPIESHLLESEKAVISLLKSADRGEIWQRELQTKTGFSKAKLSRVIRNLESRNLVDKVPFGNTNKVRLK
jgi:uncharacterized membrane protein